MYPATFPGEQAPRPIGAMPVLPQLPMWRNRSIPANVIIAWPSTNASIPAGWTRETTLDGVFAKQIPTSATAPGSTGGATTHTHPFSAHSAHTYNGHNHSASWGNSAAGTTSNNSGYQTGSIDFSNLTTHVHPGASTAAANITVTTNSTPANTDTTTLDPLNVAIVFIKSTGAAQGIPVTGVVWYNGAAPSSFSAYANLDSRLMKGAAAAGDGGAQGGTDPTAHTHTTATHTHPVNAHTHTVSLGADTAQSNDTGHNALNNISPGTHTHTLGTSSSTGAITSDATSETTGTGDSTPPWHKLRAVQRTGAPGSVAGIICMWLGSLASIPGGWILCDGTSGTPNLCAGKYVMAAASDGTVGNTGGATTHTHAAGTAHTHGSTTTHSHTFTGASGAAGSTDSFSGNTRAINGHTHASTTYTSSTITVGTSTAEATTQNANSSNNPSYKEVAYIQKVAN